MLLCPLISDHILFCFHVYLISYPLYPPIYLFASIDIRIFFLLNIRSGSRLVLLVAAGSIGPSQTSLACPAHQRGDPLFYFPAPRFCDCRPRASSGCSSCQHITAVALAPVVCGAGIGYRRASSGAGSGCACAGYRRRQREQGEGPGKEDGEERGRRGGMGGDGDGGTAGAAPDGGRPGYGRGTSETSPGPLPSTESSYERPVETTNAWC